MREQAQLPVHHSLALPSAPSDSARRLLFFAVLLLGRVKGCTWHLSSEFERDGESYQLGLIPYRGICLYLKLTSKGKPAGYSVDASCCIAALHPTDPKRTLPLTQSKPARFTLNSLVSIAHMGEHDVDGFLHNGFVTLQAVVWKPEASHEKKEEAEEKKQP